VNKNKVVYNRCFGGFSLSKRAVDVLVERGAIGKAEYDFGCHGISRHHPELVRVVEELGDAANAPYAKLAIEEIEGDRYRIVECDGNESVVTPNEREWIVIR
jgi:hypothetical protein